MDQGRTQVQVKATNRMMATFLIAMLVFISLTYAFNIIETKSLWVQKIEQKIMAKNH